MRVRGEAGKSFLSNLAGALRPSRAVRTASYADLERRLEARTAELAEAQERQTASAEVLRAIAGAPGDSQRVLETIVDTARRMFGAWHASVTRLDGKEFQNVATSGGPADETQLDLSGRTLDRSFVSGRAALDKRTIFIDDVHARRSEFPHSPGGQSGLAEARTIVSTPLLREGEAIGTITVVHHEVVPYSDTQIELLETFADQAVIAIENARLLAELRESLESQTATSEVLRVVAESTTDIEPVMTVIAERAARLCAAGDVRLYRVSNGNLRATGALGFVGSLGPDEMPVDMGSLAGRTVIEKRLIHVDDVAAVQDEFVHLKPVLARVRIGSVLGVPMMREGRAVGVILALREEVAPFSQKQRNLIASFADQAAIAIENARLLAELNDRNRDLAESLERQTASAEVLRAIADSPGDADEVLQTIASTAYRLFGCTFALIARTGDGAFQQAATAGPMADSMQRVFSGLKVDASTATGRAVVEKRTIHVRDMLDSGVDEFPTSRQLTLDARTRTILATPLLREAEALGVLTIALDVVRPFTDKQIELLETFADQAVIAIENTRLLDELRTRMQELSEALERQTASAEVLRVIASSPGDAGRVLDTIVNTAHRLFGAWNAAVTRLDEGVVRQVASAGRLAESVQSYASGMRIDRGSVAGRAVFDKRTVYVDDMQARAAEFPNSPGQRAGVGSRTVIATPLLREGDVVGTITVTHQEVRPYTDKHIELLETFADQAVIAIENARLLDELNSRMRELGEALERQTASAEVLRAIAGSPGNAEQVLDTIVNTAHRLFGSSLASVIRLNEGAFRQVAAAGQGAETIRKQMSGIKADRTTVAGHAICDKKTVCVLNIQDGLSDYTGAAGLKFAMNSRTVVATPLVREGEPIGAITVIHNEVHPYTDKQIELLETFADQAVIAIENARLLDELQERGRELAASVEEQKALTEVGQVVNSSLDLGTVLTTILRHACVFADSGGGAIYVYDPADKTFSLESTHGMDETLQAEIRKLPIRLGETLVGQCAERREPVQVVDVDAEPEDYPLRDALRAAGIRALLAVPLLRGEEIVGALIVRRRIPGAFGQPTLDLLQTFAAQSALAINNARLFREIEEKSREIEIASQHKSQFLANMSHELRTPLNAILGYTELIQDGIYGEPLEEISGVLGRVQVNGTHLLGLINDVLDLSKIEAGQLVLTLGDYALGEVVNTVTTATSSLAGEKGLVLAAEVAPDLPVAHGDERRVAQVLLNLVGNAIKFTDAGRVDIHVAAENGSFEVAVTDTGPGIAPEDQAHIFEEFHQVDASNTKEKGGTGLGLAITKRIIELHGGRIWVDSSPGNGSTFRFSLPVHAERQEVET